jgi:hypothetical protein
MPDDPTPATGGADGGAAPAVAVSSPEADAALLASQDQAQPAAQPDPDADFWKQAAERDFSKAPAEVRAKLEAPFLSQYGKKTSELDRERQQLLAVIERLATKPGEVAPTVDEKKRLLEEVANGNTDAIEGLVERMVQERTGPQMDYIATQRAIAEAAQIVPDLGKYEVKVAEALKNDPDLMRLASIDNKRYASRVIAALALQAKNADLEAQIASEKANSVAAAKKAVEDYKAQLRGLPTSTSKAGSTPTAFPPDKPMSIEEIRDKAWADAGGH